jgi:biopolymer transport protein ExbD
MDARSILPLIDLVFLTLGAILAAMTQMQRVTALPVELAQVGPGAAIVRQGDLVIVNLLADGMAIDGVPVTAESMPAMVAGRQVIVRCARSLPSERLLGAVAELVAAGTNVSLEVEELEAPEAP